MDYFERNLLLAKIELSQFDLQEMHSAASISIDIEGNEYAETQKRLLRRRLLELENEQVNYERFQREMMELNSLNFTQEAKEVDLSSLNVSQEELDMLALRPGEDSDFEALKK